MSSLCTIHSLLDANSSFEPLGSPLAMAGTLAGPSTFPAQPLSWEEDEDDEDDDEFIDDDDDLDLGDDEDDDFFDDDDDEDLDEEDELVDDE